MQTTRSSAHAVLVAFPLIALGLFGLHTVRAQQGIDAPLKFQTRTNEVETGGFRVTASRFADVSGQLRVVDGAVRVYILSASSPLKVTSTADGLQFNGVGQAGTPSELLPIVRMPFDKTSMVAEFDKGITIIRDGTGRSVTIYAYGVKARR